MIVTDVGSLLIGRFPVACVFSIFLQLDSIGLIRTADFLHPQMISPIDP
jgi:hypothetical protein